MADLNPIWSNMFQLPIAPQGTAMSGDTTTNPQQPGFVFSNLYNTYSGLLTQQGVIASKILDFSQLENDPNFQRANPINTQTLTALTSKLSLTTQSATISNGMMSMSQIQGIIPPQLRSTLLNLTSITDSNINSTKSIGSGSVFKLTSNSLLSDFTSFLKNNSVALVTILSMGAGIAAVLKTSSNSSVENTELSQITNVSVSQVTTEVSEASINETVSETITDPDQAQEVTEFILTQISSVISTPISNVISNLSDYQNVTINLQDPLGTDIRNSLLVDITNVVNNAVTNAVKIAPGLTEDQITEITTNLTAQVSEGLSPNTLGNMGLPSLKSVVDGVVSESRNGTLSAMNDAVNIFCQNVASDAGLSTAPIINGTVEPVDYLQNVKKFLDRRLAMDTTGARVGDITTIETYLKAVLQTNDMSTNNLKKTQLYLDKLLAEH